MAAAERCFDTAMEKAVDALLDSRGYSDATLTPCAEGVQVHAERPALRWKGRYRLDAKVSFNGKVLEEKEVDW